MHAEGMPATGAGIHGEEKKKLKYHK